MSPDADRAIEAGALRAGIFEKKAELRRRLVALPIMKKFGLMERMHEEAKIVRAGRLDRVRNAALRVPLEGKSRP